MKVDPSVSSSAVRPEDLCSISQFHQINASNDVVKSTLHFIIHILLFYSFRLFQCSCLFHKMKHGLEFYIIQLYSSLSDQFIHLLQP